MNPPFPGSSGLGTPFAVIGEEMTPLNREAQPVPPVVKRVLSYFMRNPQAADDLEGIARWRLLDELIRSRVEETRHALAWLVARGFLLERVAGADPVFTLNPEKIDEARRLLEHESTRAHDTE
jgi:hypothetical protein